MTEAMFRFTLAGIIGLAIPAILRAQSAAPSAAPPDTTPKITFGGFVDTYYAYDFNKPPLFDRAFTTQPARSNEFNANLAFLEAKLDAPRIRGRFALQAGTSVQANYFNEPRVGVISGPSLSQLIQEAVVGVKLANNLWVDGGIFFSHIGEEYWISRDNPTYTRSIVADFTPYYQSGVKLTWQATPKLTAQLDVVNGWQIISENNTGKSAGIRIDYASKPNLVFSYYNFLGDEVPVTPVPITVPTVGGLRFFNGVGVKGNLTEKWLLLAEFDYGIQGRTGLTTANWYGGTLIGRYQATSAVAIIGRVERFDDPDQVLILTGLPDPFNVNGASLGVDVTPASRVLWRSEVRGFHGKHAVFLKDFSGPSKDDAFVVTSLALTF